VKPARRRRTQGGDPPSEILDDGAIPFTGPRALPFLDWLRDAHPEIDALDDLLVGSILDDLGHLPAVEIVRHYCDPAPHGARKERHV
jgi:hypothetical protein